MVYSPSLLAKTRYKEKSSYKGFDRLLAAKYGGKSYINNEQYWDCI